MEKEYLDIVDENNNLTGEKILRIESHAKGIWHRVVHIYLFRKNKDKIEFLVQLRSKFKELGPNQWDTRVGGHIKLGKSIEETLNSELEEEIGIKIDQGDLIEGPLVKRDNFPNCEFTKVYFLEYKGKTDDLKFNDGEVQKVEWIGVEEIKESMAKKSKKWLASLQGFEEISNYLLKKIKL